MKNISAILLTLYCLIFVAGCSSGSGSGGTTGSGGNTGGPLTIANLAATAGDRTVTLSWTETGNTGHVEITWTPGGTTVQIVQPGIGTFTATELVTVTEYTFTVKSIDGDKNVTAELTASATPSESGQSNYEGEIDLTIPEGHPRIWFTAGTLNDARAIFDTNPFTPENYGDITDINNGETLWENNVAIENALYYLLTGDSVAAETAIAWARYNLQNLIDNEMDDGISCDRCRWWGQTIIITYDWCYDALTADDKSYFLTNISAFVERWNNETAWGTPDEPASNYNHGYMRNSFLWGVASYGENEKAQEFIDHGIVTRWGGIVDYFENTNMSGIPQEGTSYGQTILLYPIVMFMTAANLGYDIFDQEFMKRAVIYAVYNTTNSETYLPGSTSDPYYMGFSYGDASAFWDGRLVMTEEYAEFMAFAGYYWKDTQLGRYIQGWFDKTGANVDSHIIFSYIDWSNTPLDISNLPLDYYPPDDGNMGMAFTKTGWGADDTCLHIQTVTSEVGGHEHNDGLNFQIWRKGRFLVSEVPGRGYNSGWYIPDYLNSGDEDVDDTLAHNSLLFGGVGQVMSETLEADVLRLESGDNHFYTAVDGTPSYRSGYSDEARYNNYYVDAVIREYVFIRKLEALIIFDRMQSSAAEGNLDKTFLLHTWGEPTVSGTNAWTATFNNQTVKLTTLIPAALDVEIIDESGARSEYDNLWRIQLETGESEIEYFLNVVEVRDSTENDLAVSCTENGDVITLELSHAVKGYAKLTLNKGITSTGGGFAFSASSMPATLTALNDGVQQTTVTLDGASWLSGN